MRIVEKKKVSANLKNNTKFKCSEPLSDFEIRDKRIGIIFRVLYVVAAITTTLSLYRPQYTSANYPVICAGIVSFLFLTVFNLLVYIFNELKCLKIEKNSITEKQFTITEDSYSYIFIYFNIGLYVHLVLIVLMGLVGSYLTIFSTKVIILLNIVVATVVNNISSRNTKTKAIGSILYSIASYFTFFLWLSAN